MRIFDGENMILGRLAAAVAKAALLGEEIKVINCDKVIISGTRAVNFAHQKQRWDRRGYPLKSANHSRIPVRFVRRSIRGMLPWKNARGREAFKRIMCFDGVPAELAGQKTVKVEGAGREKLPSLKYVTVKDMCQQLGGNL